MIRNGYVQVTPVRHGRIHPADALEGYTRGLFPMGAGRDDDYYAWFTHVPRGVLPINGLHISRSLKKVLKRQEFEVTCDEAFEEVISNCATGRDGDPSNATWISEPIKELFLDLHELGFTHSIECWQDGELVGGLYGLHIGGAFFGESMFSKTSNASKVALVHLVGHLQHQGFFLLDTQQTTEHTVSMGAIDQQEIDYLIDLQIAVNQDVQWDQFHPRIPRTVPSSPVLPL
jgi:leucyl/phenylalanyl-tRNA--protein transferase